MEQLFSEEAWNIYDNHKGNGAFIKANYVKKEYALIVRYIKRQPRNGRN
jgi:hypothetical protein